MIIVHAVPAYRQTVHVEVARCMAQDAMTALDLGWRPAQLWVDATGIARARNLIVDRAVAAGARLLLMQDADTFPLLPQGGLGRLWSTMQESAAAVVGAAVTVRNGEKMNCEPAKPGEVYPGEVGTAYMLIDLAKLRDLPRPWFVHLDSEDGLSVVCGEDIGFCRDVKALGLPVIVDYGIPMGHAESTVTASQR